MNAVHLKIGVRWEKKCRSSTGPILFNNSVHTGAMSYVSYWISTEVSGATVT